MVIKTFPLSEPLGYQLSFVTFNRSITNDQYQQLMQAIQKLDMSNKGGNFSSISHCLINIISRKSWIIDSGASDHIVCEKSLFSDIHDDLEFPISVQLPNGNTTHVKITRCHAPILRHAYIPYLGRLIATSQDASPTPFIH